MSSSYSSLDWVLSHWAHFSVHTACGRGGGTDRQTTDEMTITEGSYNYSV